LLDAEARTGSVVESSPSVGSDWASNLRRKAAARAAYEAFVHQVKRAPLQFVAGSVPMSQPATPASFTSVLPSPMLKFDRQSPPKVPNLQSAFEVPDNVNSSLPFCLHADSPRYRSPERPERVEVVERELRERDFELRRLQHESDDEASSFDEADSGASEPEDPDEIVRSRRRRVSICVDFDSTFGCSRTFVNDVREDSRFCAGKKKKRVTFTSAQKRVMQRWRTDHSGTWAALYPSKTQCAKLAAEAHLKPKQVEKHFDNFRQRHLAGIQRPKGRPSSSAPIPTIVEGEVALVWTSGRVEKLGKVMEDSDSDEE
jgi:hypothetical protein